MPWNLATRVRSISTRCWSTTRTPTYLRDALIYKLTVEARRRVEESGLGRRAIARRLRTSVPQLYRLLDTTNSRKSMNQLVSLLHILDCSVDVVVTEKEAP